jgi:hypothetical protein
LSKITIRPRDAAAATLSPGQDRASVHHCTALRTPLPVPKAVIFAEPGAINLMQDKTEWP